MPFGLLEGLAVAQAGAGLIGSLFGKDPQIRGLGMLKRRARQGIDPKILAMMRMRARNVAGREGSALSSQAENRLLRSDAPIAKTEEVLGSLAQKRIGAGSEAVAGIDIANEQVKTQALQQLAGLPPEPGTGDAFGQLLGLGLGSLTIIFRVIQGTTKGLDQLIEKV